MDDKIAFVNKVFAGMEVVDGTKRVKKTYNDSFENKYDNILGTTMTKGPKVMGINNASLSNPKYASSHELVENTYDLIKEASIKRKLKPLNKARVKAWDFIVDADKKNTAHLSNAAKSIKNKDIKGALKHSANASKFTAPALATTALAGAGTTKLLSDLDKSPEYDKNKLLPVVVGTGVAGSMIANSINNKNFTKSVKLIGDVARDAMHKQPGNMIDKTGPVGQFARKTYSSVVKKSHKTAKDADKIRQESFSKHMKTVNKAYNKNGKNKSFNKMKKHASTQNTEFAKRVFKENFLKNGLESIPYYAAPAALSYAMSRDMRNGLKKKQEAQQPNVINIDLSKSASFADPTKTRKVFERSIERAADGVGRAIFPATVTAITGRNIMNSLEDINENKNSTNTSSDMAKIIVNVKNDNMLTGKDRNSLKRKARTEVTSAMNDIYKNATLKNPNDVSVDIGDIYEELNNDVKNKILGGRKMSVNKVHVGEGTKKSFRMDS